jgi:small-conductance mechanosensitive channel
MNVQEFLQLFGANVVDFFSTLIPEYVVPNLTLIVEVIVLFILAYVIGKIGKAVTTKLLIIVGLKRITIRSWTDDILKAVGYRGTIVGLIGDLVKWFIYIVFLGVIIQTLGFPGLVNTFNQIAIFVPKFIVAILIIVIGFLIADFLGKVFEEAARRLFVDESLGMLSGAFIKYAIALISVIMALSLIGLDTLSLTVLFSVILIGTILVFVLGIRDILPNYTAGVHIKRGLKHGEHIKIGPHSGVVEKIESTSVVLKNGNKTITIPSSFFINNPVEKTKPHHRNK